jgi:hypothetical protein
MKLIFYECLWFGGTASWMVGNVIHYGGCGYEAWREVWIW